MDILNNWYDQVLILVKVAFSMLLGSLIGINREAADKPAGVKTQMLVAGTGALFIFIGDIMLEHFKIFSASELVSADPFRLVGAVISGISFIGAGTIIRNQGEGGYVEGITTAASLLFSVIIGLSVGLSQYIVAIGVTVYGLITLTVLNKLERFIKRKYNIKRRKRVIEDDEDPFSDTGRIVSDD